MSHTVSILLTANVNIDYQFLVDELPDNWLAMSNDEKFAWTEHNGEWDNTDMNGINHIESIDEVFWNE